VPAPLPTAADRAAEAVRILARAPRPAGGEAESTARAYCVARLRAAGFSILEEPFTYSAFVGRWGTPVAGVVALAILLSALTAGRGGAPGTALLQLALGGAVLGAAARWLARDGVLSFPAQRSTSVNLVATRGVGTPAVWLMAHLDSKSQPIPILVRALGITVLGLTWLAGMVVAIIQRLGDTPGSISLAWSVLMAVAVAGAIPVIATTVGSRSPGALDNASGVATVLTAAEGTASDSVGVCLTSAEELGLAGARAWVAGVGRAPNTIVVNCDGVDDDGVTTCMYSGVRPGALVDAVVDAGSRAGVVVRAHRLLPGVLTDGVALADAGWAVVTLSKGGVRTLARIHTPRDRADHLRGTGVVEVARLIVTLIETNS
jgi:hypothetical protein